MTIKVYALNISTLISRKQNYSNKGTDGPSKISMCDFSIPLPPILCHTDKKSTVTSKFNCTFDQKFYTDICGIFSGTTEEYSFFS